MTKRLLSLLALLLPALALRAQVVTITVGVSPSALSPLNHTARYQAQEFIYLQSQVGRGGLITRLGFEKASGPDLAPLTNTIIYLKNTAASSLVSGVLDTTSYQRVWAGSFPNATASGFQEVTLQTPFNYLSTDNLAVLVLRRNGNTVGSNDRALWRYDFVTRNAGRRYYDNSPLSPNSQLTVTTVLPNLRLTFAPTAGTRPGQLPLAGLHPNPVADALHLTVAQPGQLTILDLRGRPVQAPRTVPAAPLTLPVADLPAGVYFLQLRTADGQTHCQRFVRE